VPTIDIDPDAAHDAAQRELGKPMYPKASLTDRLADWVADLLDRLTSGAASIPGGWFTVTILVLLLAVAVYVAIRVARRTMRTRRGGPQELFGEHLLSAAAHRAAAEQYAVNGEWAAAIRHRLRAIARQLEETGVLDPVPGRTATELGRDAGRALPAVASELIYAATTFNDVTYGERSGTEAAYRRIADLDDHLLVRAPNVGDTPVAAAGSGGWVQVQ
jgi:hypothetical protein